MIIPSLTNMINLQPHETPEGLTPNGNKSPNPAPQLPEPVSDHLFLNNLRPEQAREFLLNHINRKLDISSPIATKGVADYSKDVSSVNETSNQIIASINRTLNNTNIAPQDSVTKIDEVANSLNAGFAEAREILKNLNILRREFLTEFNDIQNNVTGFLDNISSNTSINTVDHVE